VEVNYNASFATGNGITCSIDEVTPLHIESGVTNAVTVWIDDLPADLVLLSSGTTVNIKIHSASGMDYIKLVQLS
jgi:hypothetical protein